MTTSKLVAYHNDPAIKAAILEQLAGHRAADELVQGTYWRNGKGCALGCTLHHETYSDAHIQYERAFGIPEMLAIMEDDIFEGLPNYLAQGWPAQFMDAIQPGADLSLVGCGLLVWLLSNETPRPDVSNPHDEDVLKIWDEARSEISRVEQVSMHVVWEARLPAHRTADASLHIAQMSEKLISLISQAPMAQS